MGMFDNIINETKRAARNVGKKTNELFEITKVNMDINSVDDKMTSIYSEIGKIYYQAVKKEEVQASEEVMEKAALIDELLSKKEELLERAAALKNEQRCSSCGASNPNSSTYCSSCGKEL